MWREKDFKKISLDILIPNPKDEFRKKTKKIKLIMNEAKL